MGVTWIQPSRFEVAGGGGGSVAFLQQTANTANTDAYTFSSENFGSAATDRVIIVAFACRGSAPNAVTSATIGGVSATIAAGTASSNNSVAILTAAVPTGTSGDVVVTLAGGMLRATIGTYRAVGLLSETADDTDATTTGSTSAVTVTAGGFIIGVVATATTNRATWTGGVTEDFDVDVEFMSASGASGTYLSTSTPTIDSAVSTTAAFAAWSFA